MKRDVEELDLPKLNPGWYWKVNPTTYGDGIWIELRREGESHDDLYLRGTSAIVYKVGVFGGETLNRNPEDITPRDIQATANKILQRHMQKVQAGARGRKRIDQYKGEYR